MTSDKASTNAPNGDHQSDKAVNIPRTIIRGCGLYLLFIAAVFGMLLRVELAISQVVQRTGVQSGLADILSEVVVRGMLLLAYVLVLWSLNRRGKASLVSRALGPAPLYALVFLDPLVSLVLLLFGMDQELADRAVWLAWGLAGAFIVMRWLLRNWPE